MMSGMGTTCPYSTGYQDPGYTSPGAPHVFPTMSVNVSMNMTMGVPNMNMGYSPDPSLQHQVGNIKNDLFFSSNRIK